MITEEKARKLADHWVQAWNSHDLAQIMSHYAEDAVLVSPVAGRSDETFPTKTVLQRQRTTSGLRREGM